MVYKLIHSGLNMKIGILTLHRSINPGAFFQAYCLQQHLAQEGHDVYIIDYCSTKNSLNQLRAILLKKNPIKAINNAKKYFSLRKSIKSKFNLLNPNKVKKLDVIIVGSDIVWDFKNHFFGFDANYFGDELFNNIGHISYAASCGSRSYNDFPEKVVRLIKNNFSAISVRDMNTFNLVKKRVKSKADIVLDPTLIYDLSCEAPKEKIGRKYILIYAFISDAQAKQIKEFSKKNDLKIISVGYHNSFSDRNEIGIDPFKWLAYFRDAEYVITSTFHGVLFSINFKKRFCYLKAPETDIKLLTTLNQLGLNDRIASNEEGIFQVLSKDINYNLVTKKLKLQIDLSKKWIKNALLTF